MNSRRGHWRALFLAAYFLGLCQFFHLPSPVWDMVTDQWANGYRLHLPFWHIVLTPFCSVADHLSVLSQREGIVFLTYVVALVFLFRRWSSRIVFLTGFLGYVAWGALLPRPMARLVAEDPDILLVDFHSHTSASHDGRKSFSQEANMKWHRAQGFNAAFITEHNLAESALQARAKTETTWRATGYRSLAGEEVSLARTHLLILGNRESVDNRPYDNDPARIPLFVRTMHQKKLPVIGTVPGTWCVRWARGNADFLKWDLDGFEIVNSAPRQLDFPPTLRRLLVKACRHKNLSVIGASDNHGYGSATAVWNALRLPGWQNMGPEALEQAILRALKEKGFSAVQVLGRAKFLPESTLGLAVSPLANAWVYGRSLSPLQIFSWAGWFGVLFLLRRRIRSRDEGK